ncbi:TonB-dependent hemoglobin/transferrin/lactoferrin family receptor [Campylobacter mucosalis]|uniref:TonB-dependent hemoglobin/transferrin/lactoferrin family receptor n=1 Tax=Campylobacter mucosalis TaxID=202 RepID=UPI0014707093|nr:TonB-dependent hemoglobin/transferrin/lactoferrin family receptor [Campylobacter mucosalis]
MRYCSGILLIIATNLLFATEEVSLDEISVTANNISSKKSQLNKSDIKRGQIYNERDLVRNETGITVTEGGRSGNNGYAIRGVDSDRVSVKVDGMEAVESFMPKFYYDKGLMNGNRNSTEIENLGSIEFSKGANSLTKGSGAIGGSVSMRTKNVDDFVRDGEAFGVYSKTAYASKNSEFKQVMGGGVKHNGIEALFQYTYKKGKETKNSYSGKVDDVPFCGTSTSGPINHKYPHLCGYGRILPDPVDFTTHSRLAKFGYRFADSHFFNTFYEDLKQDYFTEQKSNAVASTNRRTFKEKIPYKRYGFYYEYMSNQDSLVNYLKASFSKQRVNQKSTSNQYMSYPYNIANKLDLYRSYDFYQDRNQFDVNGIFSEFNTANISHIPSFGMGYHNGIFKNINRQTRYNHYHTPAKVTTNIFTYQQPVKSELLYVYLNDDIILSDKLSMNFGARFDKYHYKPQEAQLPYENSKKHKPENIDDTKFKALTYQFGIDYEVMPQTTLSYSYSTGFKAPKVEEMYFEMRDAGTAVYSRNLDLKPERAQNHELSILKDGESYAVTASVFYTRYKDFIDTSYDATIGSYSSWNGTKYYFLKDLTYRQINIDRAYIKGIEINSRFNGDLINLPREYYTTLKATYQKGSKNNGTSLLAVQPFTAIFGLGYSGEKLDVLLTSKYVARKKPKDAMYMIVPNQSLVSSSLNRDTGEMTPFNPEEYPHLSKSYVVFDLTAGYKISKNFSINFGVFNLFNKKYSTWENLRQIEYNGNQGSVGDKAEGSKRYTAPRRNFAISFEARY